MIIIENHIIAKRTLPNIPQNPNLFIYARQNRKSRNFAEISFWMQVNKKKFYGIDFNRQYVIGNYIADFYIRSLGIVIEIDGAYHNDRTNYDLQREKYMSSLGILTFRISDYDAKNNLSWALNELKCFIIDHFAVEKQGTAAP